MTETPTFVDRIALARNRGRAKSDAMFLHDLAVDEIKDRLSLVNRDFTAPVIVSGFPDQWRQLGPVIEDTPKIDLKPNTHDLVVHGLSLHWADDLVGQLVQCRHALKPDGFFICAMFGGQTLFELRASLAEAEAEITGGLSPRIAPMAEIRDLGGLLQRAGFALPVADSVTTTVHYQSPFHLMNELRHMGEANALVSRTRRPLRKDVLARTLEIYQQNYATDAGRVNATFDIIYLAGWSPSEDQQKPLRPGSAQTRLSDALGVPELNPERS